MENIVREGFICPFCIDDFGDFERLQEHVEIYHPEEESGDLAESVVQNVKGLFDKAKRGIKKLDAKMSISDFSNVNIANVSSEITVAAEKVVERVPRPKVVKPIPPDVIPLGVCKSLTSEFKKYRDESINETAIRTNMLIIRLDRLINGCPKDPSKRREFEREIVPWFDDAEVMFCPLCTAKFGLTRRRHHCRLCGRVLCHNCSQYLSFLSARKLTDPGAAHKMLEAASAAASLSSMEPSEENGSPSRIRNKMFSIDKMKTLIGGAVNKVQSAAVSATGGDDASINSLLQEDGSECMRVCGSCLNDLHRRENMMENGKPPALVEQYDRVRNLVAELKQLVPTYVRLANSINNGESMYTLKAAEEMRQKCLEKQREVDVLSKRIADDVPIEAIGLRDHQMRRNIRATTLQVLQQLVGQTTSLPTAEEYERLVIKHKEDVSRQVAAARERTMMASDRILKSSTSMPQMSSNHQGSSSSLSSLNMRKSPPLSTTRKQLESEKSIDDGWTPQQSKCFNPFLEEENPLIEQRDLIKGYLEQAATAGRLDEVEILERNLKEIEEEMKNMGMNI